MTQALIVTYYFSRSNRLAQQIQNSICLRLFNHFFLMNREERNKMGKGMLLNIAGEDSETFGGVAPTRPIVDINPPPRCYLNRTLNQTTHFCRMRTCSKRLPKMSLVKYNSLFTISRSVKAMRLEQVYCSRSFQEPVPNSPFDDLPNEIVNEIFTHIVFAQDK